VTGTAARNPGAWPDLAKRAISALVMAALALGADWLGGWPFAAFWTVAAVVVLIEWEWIVLRRRLPIAIGAGAVIAAALLSAAGASLVAAGVVIVGALCVYVLRRPEPGRHLGALGVVYAAAIAVPIILLREDPSLGPIAALYLFAIVWGTDVMAYFVGRSVGGPKLWPALSPKKTWSGFCGGVFFGAAAGALVLWSADLEVSFVTIGLSLLLAIVSQGGDLFESWLKRRYGAKDASHLIPGHGGLMDRLDGFVAAASVAFLIGLLRDPAAVASGLLVW
jgi:phosphatidate cytidylyltransferase